MAINITTCPECQGKGMVTDEFGYRNVCLGCDSEGKVPYEHVKLIGERYLETCAYVITDDRDRWICYVTDPVLAQVLVDFLNDPVTKAHIVNLAQERQEARHD